MRDVRMLLLGGAVAALAVLGLGPPAGAADPQGTLAFVNGIPGTTIDVCLNGKEIGSGVRYGRKVIRNVVSTGAKVLKIYEKDPRACRGSRLATHDFPLGPGDDLTFVVTKRDPKVLVFDNAPLGEIPPLGPPGNGHYTAVRHAAEFAINIRFRYWNSNPEAPIQPSADPLWVEGDHYYTALELPDYFWQHRATLPDSPGTIDVKRVLTEPNHRYEWIFIGTKPSNARFVIVDRVMSLPSP